MLNKLFINIIIILISLFYSHTYANEPVDIWSTEKKKEEKISTISNVENKINTSETIVIEDNLVSNIQEEKIISKRKIVGLYDPEENGFTLEMWNNTDPKMIFKLSKKINKIELSEDAKKIYTKLLLRYWFN